MLFRSLRGQNLEANVLGVESGAGVESRRVSASQGQRESGLGLRFYITIVAVDLDRVASSIGVGCLRRQPNHAFRNASARAVAVA